MEVSLGFCIIIFLILFPGLIFRRLYFHEQFSKEFNSNHNLASLLAISVVPGIFLCGSSVFIYHFFVSEISVAGLIDSYKEISNENYKFNQADNINTLNSNIYNNVIPFVRFEYIISVIAGFISGRFIRITGLDVKFKILRFKNYWFYLITGEHTRFKKNQHLRPENKKLLLTKADVLVDSNSGPLLYSGIIIDYELLPNDCNTLSKIYLFKAERYKKKENQVRERQEIPGNLLVVDCNNLININFTYVYTDKAINKKKREIVYVIFTVVSIILIPLFLFQVDRVNSDFYNDYFSYPVFKKFFIYLIFVQLLHLLNPYRLHRKDYFPVSFKFFLAKLGVIIFLIFLYWVFFM